MAKRARTTKKATSRPRKAAKKALVPRKTAAKKAAKPRKAAPRAKAPAAPKPRKTRPKKVRAPKPAEVYGPSYPYACDDALVGEPVRMRVCRPKPGKPGKKECHTSRMVVEACATPKPGKKAKQLYVVPSGQRYMASKREVARAKVRPEFQDCDAAERATLFNRGVSSEAYGSCNIPESYAGGFTDADADAVDFSEFTRANGHRPRGKATKGRPSRRNPMLVSGRNYRWHASHGGAAVVTYLGTNNDGRTARVVMSGNVVNVPVRELHPMGQDIGVGYPMTFPNGARRNGADEVHTRPTFLPPPAGDLHLGQYIVGDKIAGTVQGVARCGKGPKGYAVGGRIVSRARVAGAVKRANKAERARRDSIRTPIDVYETPWQPSQPAWTPPAPQGQSAAYERTYRMNAERLDRINSMIRNLAKAKAPSTQKAEAMDGLVTAQSTAETVLHFAGAYDPATQGREFEERAKSAWLMADPVFYASDIRTPAELLRSVRDAKRRRSERHSAVAPGVETEERVREALEMFLGNHPSKPMVRALTDAIATGQYTGILSPGQKHARSAFEYLTGVALPNTMHGTVDVFQGRPFPVVV